MLLVIVYVRHLHIRISEHMGVSAEKPLSCSSQTDRYICLSLSLSYLIFPYLALLATSNYNLDHFHLRDVECSKYSSVQTQILIKNRSRYK